MYTVSVTQLTQAEHASLAQLVIRAVDPGLTPGRHLKGIIYVYFPCFSTYVKQIISAHDLNL